MLCDAMLCVCVWSSVCSIQHSDTCGFSRCLVRYVGTRKPLRPSPSGTYSIANIMPKPITAIRELQPTTRKLDENHFGLKSVSHYVVVDTDGSTPLFSTPRSVWLPLQQTQHSPDYEKNGHLLFGVGGWADLVSSVRALETTLQHHPTILQLQRRYAHVSFISCLTNVGGMDCLRVRLDPRGLRIYRAVGAGTHELVGFRLPPYKLAALNNACIQCLTVSLGGRTLPTSARRIKAVASHQSCSICAQLYHIARSYGGCSVTERLKTIFSFLTATVSLILSTCTRRAVCVCACVRLCIYTGEPGHLSQCRGC